MKSACVFAAFLFLVGLSAAPAANAQSVQLPLDHFKCYPIQDTPPINEFVELHDQFDDQTGIVEQVLVHRAVIFCNPVQKQFPVGAAPTPIQHPNAHLKMYWIGPPTTALPQRSVVILNQFGTQQLTVLQPLLLGVPTRKLPHPAPDPDELDHFKCYPAIGQPTTSAAPLALTLRDQFDRTAEQVRLLRAVVFCNPVEKKHDEQPTPILHPEAHLACYAFTPNIPGRPAILVQTENQFSSEKFFVSPPRYLCVPSLKLQVSGGG